MYTRNLEELRFSALSCILLKVLNSLPKDFSSTPTVLGNSTMENFVEKRCRVILGSSAVWNALPEKIEFCKTDLERVHKALQCLGLRADVFGAPTVYTRDKLREVLTLFLDRFEDILPVIEKEPRANVCTDEISQC